MIISPNYACLKPLPAYKEPSFPPLRPQKCVWVAPGCLPPLLMLVGCREHRAPAQVFLSRPRTGYRGGESPAPALSAEGLCPVSPAPWRSQRGACSLQTRESSFPQPCPALWLRDPKLVLLVPRVTKAIDDGRQVPGGHGFFCLFCLLLSAKRLEQGVTMVHFCLPCIL